MKVLHYGLILYQPYEITRGLREIGVDADYILWDDFGQDWLMHGWDKNLKMESIPPPFKRLKREAKLAKFIKDVATEYDIIHFHCFPTFKHTNHMLSTYHDLKFLKSIRKTIFVSFWGCDARIWNHEIQYPWSPCKRCGLYRRTYCAACSVRAISAARKYCDGIFASGDLCIGTDYIWANLAINTEEVAPVNASEIPEKYKIDRYEEDFIIYHAFGNSDSRVDVKGYGYIRDAISSLQKEGYPIKYIFADNIPNCDIKYIQCQADLVIDQLCAGWYGSNAVECMSLGKPVVAYLRPDIYDICPTRPVPIIPSNPHSIKDTIRLHYTYREDLDRIGKDSRKYVEKFHDRKVVAQNLLEYYNGEKQWKKSQ